MRQTRTNLFSLKLIRSSPKALRTVRGILLQCDGTTAVEFAIMLALIVCGAFFAVQGLSKATRGSFEEIVLVTPAQTDAALAAPIELELATSEPEANWLAANQHQIERGVIILLLLACLCLLRRQRRTVEKSAERQELSPEKEEQLQVFLKRQEIYRILSTNIDSLFNSGMQVQQLMSKRVATVGPHTTASQMKTLMGEKQLRHLLVCDKDQRLKGIISDRDLYCDDRKTAQQVMSTDLITVPPEALVSTVISLILKERISALPIVSNDHIHGLITTTDLIMAMQCTLKLWHEAASALKAENEKCSQQPVEQTAPAENEFELSSV